MLTSVTIPEQFYCLVEGRRCKKPHPTLDLAMAEAARLHDLSFGRKRIFILTPAYALDQTNFTQEPDPEVLDPQQKSGPIIVVKKRRKIEAA